MIGEKTLPEIRSAAALIRGARHLTAFTGAGISVESGIPPFRGEGGLWGSYDPHCLELDYFHAHPAEAWKLIREIFYGHFGRVVPNAAHRVLARLETEGWPQNGTGERRRLEAVITQNIDGLHREAGSRNVIEFHGNWRDLVCTRCGKRRPASPEAFRRLPPLCECNGVLKPDFIFFGEGIPPEARRNADREARETDVMLVIGSTGEVYPAALVPQTAAENGARLIEVNPQESSFTSLASVYIPHAAGEAMTAIEAELFG
jgi:NAD-dependent deacetylase